MPAHQRQQNNLAAIAFGGRGDGHHSQPGEFQPSAHGPKQIVPAEKTEGLAPIATAAPIYFQSFAAAAPVENVTL